MKRSLEELKAANAVIREVLDSGAERSLRAIPGVVHVGLGLKERNRRVTDTLCIRVYVREKIPDERLAPDERVPSEVGGIPTDVNVVRKPRFQSVDTTRYRPVKGGSFIGNGIVVRNEANTGQTMEAGTFGCTATRTSDGAVVLLTNWHVLLAHGAGAEAPVYQPVPMFFPDFDPAELPRNVGREDDRIAKIAEARVNERVDAAIARLNLSSCCRCCGLDYRDEIVGLSEGGTPPSDRLLGLRAAVGGETVIKVGVSTGRTTGHITELTYPSMTIHHFGNDYTFTNQIEIASDDDLMPFTVGGDSGSVLVGEDGFIIGLCFASDGEYPPDGRSYANHIADVCSALGITINLDRSTHDSAGAPVRMPFRPSDEEVELYAAARSRLLAHPAGAWLWELANAHREEVVRLVTGHRPVTVAWHRAGGPALFAAALKGLRAGDEHLPAPPHGGSLRDALARIGDALRAHGSDELRDAIDAHGPTMLDAIRGSETVDDVLDALRDVPARLAWQPSARISEDALR